MSGEVRICAHCETPKPHEDFGPRKRGKFGLNSLCHKCAANKQMAHRHSKGATTKIFISDLSPEQIQARAEKERARQRGVKRRDWQRRKEVLLARAKNIYWKNPQRRIGHCIRCRIRLALKRNQKSARTAELLGCPFVWLQVHLESLFRPGMTWENYGPVWHIDHIRPCASFDLTKPEPQKICFHWTNLQPLFAEENLSKGAR